MAKKSTKKRIRVPKESQKFIEGTEPRAITAAPALAIVDHRDGNTLNNTRINLRVCEHWQNMANRKLQSNNPTGFRGVAKSRWCGHYEARIGRFGKVLHLGTFKTAQEAADAYDAAAIRLYGEFARTNTQ